MCIMRDSRIVLTALWLAMMASLKPVCLPATAATNATTASESWATAAKAFQEAGNQIGQGKYKEARAALNASASKLPAPYSAKATEFGNQLQQALDQSANPKDPARIGALVELCTELRAYEAATRLRTQLPKSEVPGDDSELAWRLFELGENQAALVEYRRKLDEELVDMWKDYYRKQIRFLELPLAQQTNLSVACEMAQQRYLVGYEVPVDYFGALQKVTRALPGATNAQEAVIGEQLIIKLLTGLGDEIGREAWENRLLAAHRDQTEACATVYLDRGLRAYEAEKYPDALTCFRKVVVDYPDTTAYGDAQFSVGLCFQQQKDYEAAIKEFNALIASKVNDYVVDPDKSDDYKSYRFRAAIHISQCYESQKDYARALEYAELARDKYKFLSYCKQCLEQAKINLESRIAKLQTTLKDTKQP